MIRHPPRERAFAALLAALAGYIDAIGFLKLGGYFVSFMSGNSTRMGVGLSESLAAARLPALLIATFVAGVVAGSIAGSRALHLRRPVLLGFVAVLVAAAALLERTAWSGAAAFLAAFAMGALNGVFERDGEVSIGVTYMTGTLVKLGQRIGAALQGGDRLAWTWYLLLWLGLCAGAVLGAVAYRHWGFGALWFAAAGFGLAAFVVPRGA